MFFRKKKIISQKPKPKITAYFFAVVGALLVCVLGVFMVSAVNNINFNVFEFANNTHTGATIKRNPNIFIPTEKVSEEENINNMTYILLVGRGGGNHDAPDLTDTIILAGINNYNETISLLSIPRDLYVEYPNINKSGKINGIYESNLYKGKEYAMQALQDKISEITGKEIDHYFNVDFNGFTEVIDALGGVEVTLEQNFVDYEFPDDNLGYKSFILRKGTWTLDGDVALMYARSRHSTSDFDRSLRQQQILSSLQEKVSQLGYFKDRKKIIELYGIFSQYVQSDMPLTKMISLGLQIKGWKSNEIISFNLNDTCFSGSPDCTKGGLLYVPIREYFNGASVLLPNSADKNKLSEYNEIQTYSSIIFDGSDMFLDPKQIVIYNNTQIPLYAGSLENILLPYGFSIDPLTGTQTLREKKFENSILYYNNLEEGDITLQALKEIIDIPQERVTRPQFSGSGTHIEIILSDDNSF